MCRSNLSSAWTFLAKFVSPVLWISFFGLGTVLFWLGYLRDKNNASPPPEMKFVMLVMWFVGSASFLWAYAGLKRVRIDGQHLLVSNYFREIRIPFSAVTDVSQNLWLNYRPVTIYFREATEFGDRATFMPKRRLSIRFWRTDPIVDELKQLAGLAPKA
jgi:hypothetical protein